LERPFYTIPPSRFCVTKFVDPTEATLIRATVEDER
jgi:hypothetical protein